MTAGWAALNTLRERCPHMPGEPCDCPSKDAALALLQTALEAAERVDEASAAVPVVTDDVWAACEELHRALRAVREGK